MGVRKNAKFMSPAEKENFVRACVMMKAEIVNPGAPPAQQYSRWDENVAIHRMIQNAFAPGAANVNFGHGGSGRYSFLSWHRYFLFHLEQQLQSHVPGVMIPYWDWTDPAPVMTDTFLGPDGTINNEVRSGYFALNAPGTSGNPTPAPLWWPVGLSGWTLPSFFGVWAGALTRNLLGVAGLPTANDLREALAMGTYPAFQNGLESGAGLSSFPGQQMHNGMHGWIGGHMGNPAASPFDPIFYLHHCNIDRLWAMWQMDGHANEYPLAGGALHHHRSDIMYPWTGGAAGYGTNATISSSIPMPDFSALGAKRNVHTLNFRNAFGYTYDTLAVIGIGLDRTGSMNGLTPDPMVSTDPDVTKWVAATRGVAAFLQDCGTVQDSGTTYVMAGVKTFRRIGAANDFAAVFVAPGYGLIKNSGPYSRPAFNSAIAGMTPGGSTPLADALLDVRNTLVEPPFGHVPADERRYLAMLTDGIRTSGALMSSIPDGSFANTAVFGMGFGTGADVDYATIASMVAKGITLSTPQIFHGENAGVIDKFYSGALAAAIGFTTVIDPVLELFAGEHAHVDFQATSAEDSFLITAQGMDFDDDSWTFHLHGPGGISVYGDTGHQHGAGGCHHCCNPDVTATRANGRLSLVLHRNNSSDECWVGTWRLMVAYRARRLDAMLMPEIGELIVPVMAGPPRGPRYSRLLVSPKARTAVRSIHTRPAHPLDARPVSTSRDDQEACNVTVNIYAHTRLRLTLLPKASLGAEGAAIGIALQDGVLQGSVAVTDSFARLFAPTVDLAALVAKLRKKDIPREARIEQSEAPYDVAKLLAYLEKRDRKLARVRDEQVKVVSHEGSPLHMHIEKTGVAGTYHVGMYVEGTYCPDHGPQGRDGGHDHGSHGAPAHAEGGMPSGCHPGCKPQPFTRILTASVAVVSKAAKAARTVTTKAAKKTKRR